MLSAVFAVPPGYAASPTASPQIVADYGHIPLSFEANQGQSYPQVRYLARGQGYGIFLADNEAVLSFSTTALSDPQYSASSPAPGAAGKHPVIRGRRLTDAIRIELLDAQSGEQPAGEDKLPGTASYFLGNDPAKWRTAVPTYARVRYSSVYPGIDLVYYGNQRQLEYDFLLAPGADPGRIALHFASARRLCLTADGNLEILGHHGQLVFHKPSLYQQVSGSRVPVQGAFSLAAHNTVRFRVGGYDHALPLTIDPVLIYATCLGGTGQSTSGDRANAIAVNSTGNAYIAGSTDSSDFPLTTGSYQGKNKAGFGVTAFVTKLNPGGSALVYSTYLGGSTQDSAQAIAIDSSGNAYVAGQTYSSDFPVTSGAILSHERQPLTPPSSPSSTLLEPLSSTPPTSAAPVTSATPPTIAVDAAGDAFVAGYTDSADFPVTSAAYQKTNKAGNAGVVEDTAFVSEFNPAGNALIYSTYLGGSGNGNSGRSIVGEHANAIALDGTGSVYVAGLTYSPDFPTTTGAYQAVNNASKNAQDNGFISKLNAAGSALVYSTFLGGSGNASGPTDIYAHGDAIYAIALDASGNAYLTGEECLY